MNPIAATDIARMAWNASLYTRAPSSSRGNTLWIISPLGVRVVATDDYFILVDHTPGVLNAEVQYLLMDLKNLKALIKGAEEAADGLYDLDLLPGDPLDIETVSQLELYKADRLVADSQTLGQAFEVDAIAVEADRLRNLARVRPGDYPIDLKIFSVAEELIAFKIGPTVRGVIAPLDRGILSEQFTDEELWV